MSISPEYYLKQTLVSHQYLIYMQYLQYQHLFTLVLSDFGDSLLIIYCMQFRGNWDEKLVSCLLRTILNNSTI